MPFPFRMKGIEEGEKLNDFRTKDARKVEKCYENENRKRKMNKHLNQK